MAVTAYGNQLAGSHDTNNALPIVIVLITKIAEAARIQLTFVNNKFVSIIF